MRQMKQQLAKTGLVVLLILGFAMMAMARFAPPAENGDPDQGPVAKTPRMASYVDPANRLHDVGRLWLTITNHGYFGNDSPGDGTALIDPCTGDWSPQAEYPGGSEAQYLFQGAIWVGAMIQEEGYEYPRVSNGTEGWFNNLGADEEFYAVMDIEERTVRANQTNCLGDYTSHPDAISEQDFITAYADTVTTQAGGAGVGHPQDGPHVPLGVKVTQKSYAWSYNYAQDFIIMDYEIENIADKFLKNLYVGLYVDADCGIASDRQSQHYADDICGFTKTYEYSPPGTSDIEVLTINTAWIADNDGRRNGTSSGTNFTCPDVTGSRVVRAPNPRLRTSFNWWISNGDPTFDFGPAWVDDGSQGNWTATFGTPITDSDKYHVLSNGEFDYDQIRVADLDWISDNPQQFRDIDGNVVEEHEWRQESVENGRDIANGFDTRYLISWGPLGVFDFIDESGNRIYRLNPGEKFSMTIAYVAGSGFHDRNNPQTTDEIIDPNKFNYADFQYNADWASKVYDNPMIDTPDPNTGIQDGWFGEDVGIDCVYAAEPGMTVSFYDIATDNLITLEYPGKDTGERDGKFQPQEDVAPRPKTVDYTYGNELFDQGDGFADFQGPPPPPTPVLKAITDGNDVILQWTAKPSEDSDYRDPFSRQQDFEGYRVYVSNTGQENEFSFLASFDNYSWSYYTENDSLLDSTYYADDPAFPDVRPDLPPTKAFPGDILGYLQPIGLNTGKDIITAHRTAGDDSTYQFVIENAHPMVPLYYSVTSYDFGDYRSGTEPLESAKSANMQYVAPDGYGLKKVGVVPNPYRADQDYTRQYLQIAFDDVDTTSVSWENRDDGTAGFFPQTDRRIYFYNLPEKCLIRIFTVSGDLIDIVEHDVNKNGRIGNWNSAHAEAWDMNSRNKQQIVSGIYIFSVEDMTEANKGNIDVGKFVVIR